MKLWIQEFSFSCNIVNDEQQKMNSNSMEADLFTKQEGHNTNDGNLGFKPPSSSQWMRTKDPRIVRVSRAFGGKDRHSKVCTIRGLRDRRVRLSVPTAIQLYDLQDRLGFNQPSKVVDWLLDAAKNEIEELPPLPMIPGHFSQNYQSMLTSHQAPAACSSNEGLMGKGGIDLEDSGDLLRSNFWSSNAFWENKSKEVARETVNKEEKEDIQEDNEGQNTSSTYNFLTKTYHPSFQGVLNNSMSTYGSYQNLMPSNFSLSHPGSYGFTSQAEDLPNLNIVTMPSTLSLSTGSQVFVCPPGAAQSYLPSFLTSSMEIDPRHINHFQMLSSNSHTSLSNPFAPPLHSTSQNMRPLHFNLTPLHSQDSGGSQPTKDH